MADTFTISRNDFAFNFGKVFEKQIGLRLNPTEKEFRWDPGVVVTESLGFDFKNEYRPSLKFKKLPSTALKEVEIPRESLEVVVTVTDTILKLREVVKTFRVSELFRDERIVNIPLADRVDMGFFGGLEIGIFIKPRETDFESEALKRFWHRSQVIYSIIFELRSTIESEIFKLHYVNFGDDEKDVIYRIAWKDDGDVMTGEISDTFEVHINEELKDEFKLLQLDKKFGNFGTRLIFAGILREIIEGTLIRAEIQDLDDARVGDGAAYRFVKKMFDLAGCDIETSVELASGEGANDKSELAEMVSKVAQINAELGTFLQTFTFGEPGGDANV